jgi:molybdopterin molybdotransferase
MSDLLSVADALQRILNAFSPTESVNIDTSQAYRKVLAEDVIAGIDLPVFSNSSMDGYAVRATDVADASPDTPVVLQVVGDIAAGYSLDIELGPGQAVRIMTGGPLPAGSDAVVPVEETKYHAQVSGLTAQNVAILRSFDSGDYVRPKGQDVRAGELVLRAGARLRPQDVGLIAMLGIRNVSIHRSPRVAVFSSGDELLSVGEPISYGKIYNSNSYTLISLIAVSYTHLTLPTTPYV